MANDIIGHSPLGHQATFTLADGTVLVATLILQQVRKTHIGDDGFQQYEWDHAVLWKVNDPNGKKTAAVTAAEGVH